MPERKPLISKGFEGGRGSGIVKLGLRTKTLVYTAVGVTGDYFGGW